ncbi:histidine-rich protein PFHRP-II, partial [Plasmodium falciparum Vietnam Oak-Knoll (FVO)]
IYLIKMVSFSKNKVLSAAVFASVLLLDNNNSAFNNNLCSKNAKGLNLNKRLLHETQAHVDDAHHAHPPPCGNITFLYLDKHTSSQIYKVHIISSPPNLHTCNF